MIHGHRRYSAEFDGEVPVSDAVERVTGGCVETQGLCGRLPIDEVVPASAAAPNGDTLSRFRQSSSRP